MLDTTSLLGCPVDLPVIRRIRGDEKSGAEVKEGTLWNGDRVFGRRETNAK
jgi:hypothetical protein